MINKPIQGKLSQLLTDDMTMERCRTCNGRKQIAPLGSVYKDCTECKASGYKDYLDPLLNPVVDNQSKAIDKPKRQYNRQNHNEPTILPDNHPLNSLRDKLVNV